MSTSMVSVNSRRCMRQAGEMNSVGDDAYPAATSLSLFGRGDNVRSTSSWEAESNNTSLSSALSQDTTADMAQESTLQALFAEQTASEMAQAIRLWESDDAALGSPPPATTRTTPDSIHLGNVSLLEPFTTNTLDSMNISLACARVAPAEELHWIARQQKAAVDDICLSTTAMACATDALSTPALANKTDKNQCLQVACAPSSTSFGTAKPKRKHQRLIWLACSGLVVLVFVRKELWQRSNAHSTLLLCTCQVLLEFGGSNQCLDPYTELEDEAAYRDARRHGVYTAVSPTLPKNRLERIVG